MKWSTEERIGEEKRGKRREGVILVSLQASSICAQPPASFEIGWDGMGWYSLSAVVH
jgi:hypothetical protein